MAAPSLKTVLSTSSSLIDQFLLSFNLSADSQPQSTSHPSPLHLLSAAAISLRSTTTKLSLLTITTPFTPSAIVSTLQPLNTSILPSLVTATLLTSPVQYPESFSKECTLLTSSSLRDLKHLLSLIKSRSEDGRPTIDMNDGEKQQVTESTGKVWEDCDSLLRLAKEDVCGFVVRKAKSWLELMKDAVKELEEWDPAEEDVDDQDWLGLDGAESGDEDHEGEDRKEKKVDMERATISAGVKDQALKVLSRIPQSIHVVVKQRLEKYPPVGNSDANETFKPIPSSHRRTMNVVLKKTRLISDCIDESAEAMYLGDPELCLKKAGEARALTIHVVEAVVEPWMAQDSSTKEDQYIQKALAWIQQVDTGSSTVKDNTKAKIEVTTKIG